MRKQPEQGGFRIFLGFREHEMRSNPYIIGGKIPFDPNIIC